MKLSNRFFLPALAAGLLTSGCVAASRQSARAMPCEIQSEGTLVISLGLLEMAPGESRQLPMPMVFTSPHSPPDSLATYCQVRWSAEGGATVDGSGRLTIARDALPGSTIEVRAHVDTVIARKDIHIVDPAPNPLAATWSQNTDPVCTNGARSSDAIIRELVFNRGGTFTVTRMPFETYRDYWGSYTYDASTGKLRLTVVGGNVPPLFRSTEVVARVVGSELVIEGTALHGTDWMNRPDSVRPDSCRSVFRHAGAPR